MSGSNQGSITRRYKKCTQNMVRAPNSNVSQSHRQLLMDLQDLLFESLRRKFTSLTHYSITSCLFHLTSGGPMHIPDMLEVLALKVSQLGIRKLTSYTCTDQHNADIFALIATHEGHKTIRDPVEKLYSKISTHEPQVQDCSKKFCRKLNQQRDMNSPVNLSHACLSLALGRVNPSLWKYHIVIKIFLTSAQTQLQPPPSKTLLIFWTILNLMKICLLLFMFLF